MNETTETPTEIEFNGKHYSEATLKELSIEDLTALRNLAAEWCGVRRIKKFASKPKGVAGAWQAMQEANKFLEAQERDEDYEPQIPNAEGKVAVGPAKTPAKPKCDEPEIVKRPTAKMFYRVKKTGVPNDSQRPGVWGRYKDGDRIIDLMEADGVHAGKVHWWVNQGIMELVNPGSDVIEREMREWYQKHGREYPGDEAARKEREKQERAEAKKAKEAEAKKAKEAKEAEKAKKSEAKKSEPLAKPAKEKAEV
jgi:hypothetical protein